MQRKAGAMSYVLFICGVLLTLQVDGAFHCPRVSKLKHLKGSISSPNYPRSYVRNTCIWIISVPPKHTVKLTFVEFDLLSCPGKCACDFVEVRDGGTQSSPLITKLCGKRLAPMIYSTSTELWIKYRSRDGSMHKGFYAYYTAVKVYERLSRIVYLNENNGTITSPVTPSSCGFKRRCTWVIQAASEHCIELGFQEFRLRPHKCGREFVEVKDGANSSSTVIDRFCGNSAPRMIVSKTRYLFIRFKYNTSTDLTVYGFVATYAQTTNCTIDTMYGPLRNQRTSQLMTEIPDRTSIVVGIACASLFLLVVMIACVIKISNRDSPNARTTEQTNTVSELTGQDDYIKLPRHSARIGSSSNSYLEHSDTLITEAPELDAECTDLDRVIYKLVQK